MERDLTSFKFLAEYIYDPIHLTDGEGRVIFVNEAYTRVTGITPAQCIGRRVQDIEEEGILYKGSVTGDVIRTRQRINSVAVIKGLGKEVLVTGTPVFDEAGELCYVLTSTRDIGGLNEMKAELDTLKEKVDKDRLELEYLRKRQLRKRGVQFISECMKPIYNLVDTIAPTDVTVLITGESGTGKEIIADSIYNASLRKNKPFIKVNCAAIPVSLLESELFGYEKGAFTDARKDGKPGMFELANTGTIMLDEIGDMPLDVQTKLLRILQHKSFMRVGGTKEIQLDVRIIAATNHDLKEDIAAGKFREDLYYRLNVVPIKIKPLRERRDEIAFLLQHFLEIFNTRYSKNISLSDEAVKLLVSYDWPGNVRELENLMERLVVTTTEASKLINAQNVAPTLGMFDADAGNAPEGLITNGMSLKECVKQYEIQLIKTALANTDSKRQAAKMLKMDHSTLIKKCQSYGIE